jgi:YVTN family beta-propeller protein
VRFLRRLIPLALGLAAVGAPRAPAQAVTASIALPFVPAGLVVNPLTNRIYASDGDHIAVIDGSTNQVSATLLTGGADVVNPVTDMLYGSHGPFSGVAAPYYVTATDVATGATQTLAPGSAGPMAVDTAANRIFVANVDAESVTVIDGATNAASTVYLLSDPEGIAVNPVTGTAYVSLQGGGVTAIDGATGATRTAAPGAAPGPVAVNPVTNKVYVSGAGGDSVAVIDGATLAATTVAVGGSPGDIAVNPLTNRVYVSVGGPDGVAVIDGATDAVTLVPTGAEPVQPAVDMVLNRVYVPNYNGADVTVIDGATNAASTVPAGPNPGSIAVNPVTGMVYVANAGSAAVSVVFGPAPARGSPAARLVNISTRAPVGQGGDLLIPGFVVAGPGLETLLVRAAGPALARFGIAGALAQPSLAVFDSSGSRLASNTGWGSGPNPSQVAGASAQAGAFPFAAGSADSALLVTLPAGSYTAEVSGAGGSEGTALAEVYEVASTGTRLANISSRAQVGAAGTVVTGFVVAGSGGEEILLRADGPALAGFGVSGVLSQPVLSLADNAGSPVASNAGWAGFWDPGLIAAVSREVGAFALPTGASGITSADSAQVVTLAPGAYTMTVSGAGGSSGVALSELYEVP